jgi:Metal-dependent hydrolases of the beta-lactamase superfamily II
MLIKALVENTTVSKNYKCIHGLSLYIETENHKILFDLGPGKLFYDNACKMNINIEDVDTVVISHGHNDHGGALKTFLNHNTKAKVYLSDSAFEAYYYRVFGFNSYTGLDKALKDNNRIIFTGESLVIDDELQLFSKIREQKYLPNADNKLYQKIGRQYHKDTFQHEQSLLIKEQGNYTLFAGCAHCGIVNILEKAEEITKSQIKTVIGGLHLYHLSLKKEESIRYLEGLSEKLKEKNTLFYTCHCTGEKPYEILHKHMGEQIKYLSTGGSIELNA